jgi:RHS repeat-associated protein
MLLVGWFVNSSEANFGFTGQAVDSNGQVYLRARYYDPETGTFLTKDPLGINGGMNGLQYCKSDPVNLKDPSGNWALIDDLAFSGAGALIGLGSQFVSDALKWTGTDDPVDFTWSHYGNAAFAGAAGGEISLYSTPFVGVPAATAYLNLQKQSELNYSGQRVGFLLMEESCSRRNCKV